MGQRMKYVKQFDYAHGQTEEVHGERRYDILGMKLPSVTTILDKTKDKSYLKKWIERKGEKEAERIKDYSSRRGTAMHKFIEKYIQGTGFKDLTPIGQEAEPMAQKIIEIGLAPITEYYGSEVTLQYMGQYAGATDLICMHNGQRTVVDFKQSNRPKQREWIDDYFMQIAAYAMAHDYQFGPKTWGENGFTVDQGVIMVCTPDLYYQEFKIKGEEMRQYRHKFLARLDKYQELKS